MKFRADLERALAPVVVFVLAVSALYAPRAKAVGPTDLPSAQAPALVHLICSPVGGGAIYGETAELVLKPVDSNGLAPLDNNMKGTMSIEGVPCPPGDASCGLNGSFGVNARYFSGKVKQTQITGAAIRQSSSDCTSEPGLGCAIAMAVRSNVDDRCVTLGIQGQAFACTDVAPLINQNRAPAACSLSP